MLLVSQLTGLSGRGRGELIRALSRFTDRTVIAIAIDGVRSHGDSMNRRPSAASLSITPQLGVIDGNPRPTYDSVASETMNAGSSTVACTPTKLAAAGRRWCSSN